MGSGVSIRRRGEHDRSIVGRELDLELFTGIRLSARETRGCEELGPQQQVARGSGRQTVRVERLDEDAHLSFVEPAVPAADREAVVGAHIRLARAARFHHLLVSRIVVRFGKHD
jgi:hypothetical protein